MWKRGLYFKTEAEENIVYGKIVDFIAGEQTSRSNILQKGNIESTNNNNCRFIFYICGC